MEGRVLSMFAGLTGSSRHTTQVVTEIGMYTNLRRLTKCERNGEPEDAVDLAPL